MIKKLNELNPSLKIYSVYDEEFKKYGKVYDFETKELTALCQAIPLPQEGSSYQLSMPELEKTDTATLIKNNIFGGMEIQVGLCMGYNTEMNALEFHKSSEINIAVTPLLLLLGLEYEMEDLEYNSSKLKAFYVNPGTMIEIYGTTLHFCPCQVSDDGFSSIVILHKHTNELLENNSHDKLLFKTNKWLLCHKEKSDLIAKGVFPGIDGENYKINY